jgi:hypothetical protein
MRPAVLMFASSAAALMASCGQSVDCQRTQLRSEVSPDQAWIVSQTKIVCGAGADKESIEIEVRRSNASDGDIGDIAHFEGKEPLDIAWGEGSVALIARGEGRFSSDDGVTAELTVPMPPRQRSGK